MLPTGVSDAFSHHEFSLLAFNPILEVFEGTALREGLDVDSVSLDLLLLLQLIESGHNVVGESVFTGNEHLLSSWELELGSSEGLLGVLDVMWGNSNGHEN